MLYKGTKKEHKCWQHSCSKEISIRQNLEDIIQYRRNRINLFVKYNKN